VDIISTSRGNGQYSDSKEFLIVRVKGLTPEQIQKYLTPYQEVKNITDTVNLASRKNYIDIKNFSKSVGVIPEVINAKDFSPVEKTAAIISQYQKRAKLYTLMSPLRKLADKIIPKVYAVTTNVRYVDADAEAGGNGTTNCILSCGGTAAYASLNIWETARDDVGDLVTNDTIEEAVLESSSANHTADTAAVTINGWTTSATNYINIYTTAAARHNGTYQTNKYRLEVANASSLVINEDYVRIDGLQIKKTSSSADYQANIYIASQTTGACETRISNSILVQAGNNSYAEPGVIVTDADAVVYIWNLITYGSGTLGSNYNSGITALSGSTVSVYSCTLIGSYHGLYGATTAIVTVKNCYASKTGIAAAFGGNVDTMVTSASSDTSGSAGLQNIAVNTTNFTNVSAGTEDLHLPAGSALINVGTDTSGDAAPLNFTTDIDGETRSGTWDIGADEYVAAGGGAVGPNLDDFLIIEQ